jgi:murein DD-endopeptidase MepM/ murein hydrolase activator NlpD
MKYFPHFLLFSGIRKRMMNLSATILLILSCSLPFTAFAQQWAARQGDLLTIDLPSGGEHLHVLAFGKAWPWKRLDGQHVRAWIGIDLRAKPGEHDIVIRDAAGEQQDSVLVSAGDFRISRITVTKKMAVFDAPTLRRILADQSAIRKTYTMPVKAYPDISISKAPVEGVVSTPFGAQRFVNGKPREPHAGVDFAAPEGTPIITPMAGRVLVAESMYLNGNTVVIGCGNDLVMIFSHLKALEVKQGDWLQKGERIGRVGMTGRVTGPNLHWGVVFNQARINPLSLLAP